MALILNEDTLKSWNDGPVKQSILDFLKSSIEQGPNYVKPADRIATFDNDGTLWVERPMPAFLDFLFRVFAILNKTIRLLWLLKVLLHGSGLEKLPMSLKLK
jgi:hypothetical protein